MADVSVDNMAALIEAFRSFGVPHKLHDDNGVASWLLPGGEVERVEYWRDGPVPPAKRGTVVVFDVASFNMVLRDNADQTSVSVYVDREPLKPLVVAVMNGHGPSGPGWGDFRVRLEFRPTPQWVKWSEASGRMMPQLAFAEFIEDNVEDITDPPGAQMLEIATYLEAARTVNFRSGIKLSSGAVQFNHEQDDVAKVGAGSVAVPEQFVLGIAPFTGLPSYRVPARFRYRLVEGRLTLGFKLQRSETLMAQIVAEVVKQIERGESLTVLDGLAPAPLR